jgi:hypothetical protein
VFLHFRVYSPHFEKVIFSETGCLKACSANSIRMG